MTTQRRSNPADVSGVRPDAGFTLVEVIVALTLLALLSSAALYFFVNGTRSLTHQQRSHGAVSAANDAMEQVFSFVPQMTGSTAATSSTALVTGRLDTDVTAAFSSAAGLPGVSDTYPAWDRSTSPAPAAGVGDDRLKLVRVVRTSGVDYTITTLIGYCYRVATNPAGACTKVGGDSVGTPSAGYVRMVRSIVVVRWPGTSAACSSGICSYQIQSLIDPNDDLKWNNTTRLQAFDDAVSVNAGETVTIDVLDNDSVMELSSNPVSLTSFPAVGSATVDPGSGKVLYSAPANGYGEVTFGYQVVVGARSTMATIHVYITPKAPDYTASVLVGAAVEVTVTPPDGSTPASLQITQAPSVGTVTTPTTSRLRYQAGATAGTYSFRYTYRDAAGVTSLAGTVTVTVTTYAPATATNLDYPVAPAVWTAAASPAPQTLDLRARTGNPTGYLTVVNGLPAGTLRTSGGTPVTVGTPVPGALAWTAPANQAGVFRFPYVITVPDSSADSPEGTVTMRVLPTASNLTANPKVTCTWRGCSPSTPATVTFTGIGATSFAKVNDPSCATVSISGTTVTITAKTTRTTCTFQYTASWTDGVETLTSAPATVSISVTT